MKKRQTAGYVIVAIIVIILIALGIILTRLIPIETHEQIREFVSSLGYFGFLGYIFLVALSIPLSFPSTIVVLSGGYLYGAFLGSILAMLGILPGSAAAFYISRIAKKFLLKRLANVKQIKLAKAEYKKYGLAIALISYSIPFFPSDITSFALGLTKIKFKEFMILVFAGHIPRLIVLGIFGASIYKGLTIQSIIIEAIVVIIMFFLAFNLPMLLRRLK